MTISIHTHQQSEPRHNIQPKPEQKHPWVGLAIRGASSPTAHKTAPRTPSQEPKFISRSVLTLPIRIYKVCLSPFLGKNCRFHPSCSSYSIEAIERHGCLKGLVLAIKRICRCHPFNPGGVDHVPGHNVMESEYNE